MSQRPLEERIPVAAHPHEPEAAFAERVRMRDATADDIATLVPLINAAYRERDGWLFSRMRVDEEFLREEFGDERTTTIVADIDGGTAGFAVVRRRDDHAEFGLLAVHRAWQRNGLARLIVAHAEKLSRDAGFSELRLDCIRENGLPPFYEALGFTVHAESFASRWNSSQPFTLVEMRKSLQ
jgi:GNAT superfamily N-acetyltransferase